MDEHAQLGDDGLVLVDDSNCFRQHLFLLKSRFPDLIVLLQHLDDLSTEQVGQLLRLLLEGGHREFHAVLLHFCLRYFALCLQSRHFLLGLKFDHCSNFVLLALCLIFLSFLIHHLLGFVFFRRLDTHCFRLFLLFRLFNVRFQLVILMLENDRVAPLLKALAALKILPEVVSTGLGVEASLVVVGQINCLVIGSDPSVKLIKIALNLR